MDFTQQMIRYYKGERFEAILLTILGILTLGIAAMMWRHISQNQLLKGLFYPVVFLSVFTLATGGFGVYNNNQRLERFPSNYMASPDEFVRVEVDRFENKNGVNTWWMPLKITWAILVLTGIALSFTVRSEFVNGIAIGLILIGAFGFIIDGFAHQRAKIYTEQVKIQPK